ncbi:serine hydrolase domain-containing protein [Alterisphingorhabdus coralli]|uniref:Serine hydrolase domain-containing protein n=1 Tax=Alterisphingorhabdus coralli TaxID=3071408 RepID=A0AA97I0T9_9SPHN|nr:serine hydrolase domain-containing protein [Parasphingorhabdus sp. SCSIO 66989]WOE76024.1 serine hydrolase domain-containing protein [Parasphingorhabdus sp. SCSIO 66989]
MKNPAARRNPSRTAKHYGYALCSALAFALLPLGQPVMASQAQTEFQPATAPQALPQTGKTEFLERLSADDISEAVETLQADGYKGVIAVARDMGPPIIHGFGDQVSASGLPDGMTQVDILSITKTITAAAAMKLVDGGKLSTAERLGDIFPNVPADKAGITVHQLLTHSAGLQGSAGDDLIHLNKDKFFQTVMAEPLRFKPGTDYYYSNIGYSLVAAIIEARTGMAYEDYLRTVLFADQNITHIGYGGVFDPRHSLLTAKGEVIDKASWGGSAHWALIGNGGLVATAPDMIRLLQSYMGRTLVSAAATELARTPMQREGKNAPTHYGYGLVVEDHAELGRIYWHNGGNPWFSSNWTYFADHHLLVFTASQGHRPNADKAAMVIARSLILSD